MRLFEKAAHWQTPGGRRIPMLVFDAPDTIRGPRRFPLVSAAPARSPPPRAGWPAALALAALAWLATDAHVAHASHASDGAPPAPDWALTAASGDRESVRKLGLLAGWQRPLPLWQGRHWQVTLRHEVELATWQVPRARRIVEWGYSPVFVLERPNGRGVFLEGAIGVRLLSHTRLSATRSMSTAFHFSDMLGLGLRWGGHGRSTLGVRLQHLSNLGIKRPNPGINFLQLYYRHQF